MYLEELKDFHARGAHFDLFLFRLSLACLLFLALSENVTSLKIKWFFNYVLIKLARNYSVLSFFSAKLINRFVMRLSWYLSCRIHCRYDIQFYLHSSLTCNWSYTDFISPELVSWTPWFRLHGLAMDGIRTKPLRNVQSSLRLVR